MLVHQSCNLYNQNFDNWAIKQCTFNLLLAKTFAENSLLESVTVDKPVVRSTSPSAFYRSNNSSVFNTTPHFRATKRSSMLEPGSSNCSGKFAYYRGDTLSEQLLLTLGARGVDGGVRIYCDGVTFTRQAERKQPELKPQRLPTSTTAARKTSARMPGWGLENNVFSTKQPFFWPRLCSIEISNGRNALSRVGKSWSRAFRLSYSCSLQTKGVWNRTSTDVVVKA